MLNTGAPETNVRAHIGSPGGIDRVHGTRCAELMTSTSVGTSFHERGHIPRQAAGSSMEEVGFCQRNMKAWVTVLVVLATFVLAFSAWSAWKSGRMSGFSTGKILGGYGGGHSVPVRGPGAVPPQAMGRHPAAGPGPGPMGNVGPVPPRPMANAAAAMPVAAVRPIPAQAPVDVVTRATPGGGIQFINNNGMPQAAPAQHWTPGHAFNQAADIIRPSVVNISAIRPRAATSPTARRPGTQFLDPFDGVPDRIVGSVAMESVGSGLIVRSDGFVVTNHHVVAGASTIVVSRFNRVREHLTTRIVAADPKNDLALLQVQGDGPFQPATLANSTMAEVGDWVLAVGNPFGLQHTVTAGIVSGKRSELVIGGIRYRGLLQTDAPINKGSSGGPLVDLSGRVLGINTAIYAPTGVFSGTGFAIPSNRVGAFVARTLEHQRTAPRQVVGGRANPAMPAGVARAGSTWAAGQQAVAAPPATAQNPQRAVVAAVAAPTLDVTWLGVGVVDMTPDLANKLSFPHVGGVYVSSLVLDSPADEAEVTRGDIITSLASQPVQNTESLRRTLAGLTPGQRISITIWRNGRSEKLPVDTRFGKRAGGGRAGIQKVFTAK